MTVKQIICKMSNPATLPTPVKDVQGDNRWMSMHERFLHDGKFSPCNVLFIGDSLIRNMKETEAWDTYFAPLNSLNFGIGGDCTEHVLWRIENGELDNINPKVVVLLIGTNNHHSTADQVVEGIESVVWSITSKLPSAKIIVLGLLPRGKQPNPLREKHFQVNHSLKELIEAIPNSLYLDSDPGFVRSDGVISHEDMFDYLHMTRKGYKKFCKHISEVIVKFLKY